MNHRNLRTGPALASAEHLICANSPLFTEAQLIAADLENNRNKAAKAAARQYIRALDEKIADEIRNEWRAA